MNILFTGAAGYVGSQTVHALLKSKFASAAKIVVYDNLSTGFVVSIPAQAQFIQGDIRDTEKLSKCLIEFKIDTVIHFAAKLIVPESVKKPIEYYDNNVAGTISLIQACKNAKVTQIIFSSSGAVYGEPLTSENFKESDLTSPINPYGQSKLMAEKIITASEADFGMRSVCLRYFNVAGAAADRKNGQLTKNATHLIHLASQTALGFRSCLDIFGSDFSTPDGTGVRDYIHVEDLADLHILALSHIRNSGNSQILNCGYGHGFSVNEVITTMKKISGVNFETRQQPRRAGDPSRLVANAEKIKSLFNWKPRFDDLEFICKSAWEWEKIKPVAINS